MANEYADPIPAGLYWLDVPEKQLAYWYLWVKVAGARATILKKEPYQFKPAMGPAPSPVTWFLFRLTAPVKRWRVDISPTPDPDLPHLSLPVIAESETLTAAEAHADIVERAVATVKEALPSFPTVGFVAGIGVAFLFLYLLSKTTGKLARA